jgi:glucose-1-phosphate cytidylyltransferase
LEHSVKCRDLGVIILCGGQGTRLREETEFKPKPMVAIGGRPILWHIMRIYDYFGCDDFHLCLGYKAEVIKDYFLNYRSNSGSHRVKLDTGSIEAIGLKERIEPWRVSLIDTGIETLTGTRVKRALEVLDGDRFFLTYGDGVADIDVDRLLAHHIASGRLATVTAVRPSSRFGELDIEGDRLRNFVEKPQVGSGWINGGFMVFERKAFDILSPDGNEPLETAVLEPLSSEGQVSVFRHDGFWQCMDTFREVQLLETMWAEGRAAWQVWQS